MSVLGRIPRKAVAAALFHKQQNSEKRVTILRRGLAVGLVASVPLVLSAELFAGGEWPDGPNKHWFQGLKRPDNAKHPYRDEKSLFCCGVADTVKTKFKVEPGDERYPEDRWYAWIKDEWLAIPPEKIVQDYAPDGQAYLFMLSDTVQCFVRPKGGL
jgi:hypothetical protein